MPYGFHLSTCFKCGNPFICGDCIDFVCPDCKTEEILKKKESEEKHITLEAKGEKSD